MSRRRRADGSRDLGPLFAPPVRRALLLERGSVTVRYTVPSVVRRGRLAYPTPILGTGLVGDRLVALTLGVDHRLTFVRTGFGVSPRQARTDVASHLSEPYWTIALDWDDDTMTVSVTSPPAARTALEAVEEREYAGEQELGRGRLE